ncbi:hypothetical protein N4P33_08295 [Streptomyces sp. 15-116A]|uniref:hypothetical protein n=1 Tax=Streptomyces sp. 15-116A TaxID=2259035 RepID=UPI0021B1E57D|nr:hypothetical protein [Streptomyces sp. 15-116A]MCT7352174.1 hypothetical protein [Streptomyces sp. 15-116A]
MHSRTRRTCAAAAATLTLAAALAACTGEKTDAPRSGSQRDKAAVRACADGTFTWSGVKKTEKLTGVAARQRVGRGGAKLTEPLRRVYAPRPSVRAEGPGVSAAEVLFSLGKKTGVIESEARTLAEADGETWSFTDVHAQAPALGKSVTAVEGAGDIVQYAGVREVAGAFRYVCPGGKTTTGHARSWQVDIGGVLDCGESVDDSDLARQAAQRSCPAGSAAAKAA